MHGSHTSSFSNETGTKSKVSNKKSFLQGIQNARHLLNKLDRSLQKTNKYETRLLQCKATHAHTHNEPHDMGQLEVKETISSKSEKPSASSLRSPIDLAESWSTMSIVCLQYQYEELSKRYESLLQAYHERCNAMNARDASVQRLQDRVKIAQDQLACTHKALLTVGEKYLKLRCKKLTQKSCYEDKCERLRQKMRKMLSEVERARLELDDQISQNLSSEHDTAIALLLSEIKKCNLLFLENIRLKVKLEELSSK
ncbi:uncharacterized protein [Epargyreus clarus]|uniref:uncharacterized protein n=1 Tax=Epargyreus clarus TaxID=520877 RepID=UPI003C2C671C